MITFGVVGTGWRTAFFLNVANALPERFRCVGVVSRNPEQHTEWAAQFGGNLFSSLNGILAESPDFVVTSVPWDANPGVIESLVERGVPVLSETPPATTIEDMARLYKRVENGAKIAVAEQYHLHPHHAARIALVDSGKLGTVTQAQVSVAHGYHGISLIRRLLGVGFENCTITAQKFTSPVLRWRDRDPIPQDEQVVSSEQVIAHLDFGDKLGVFDFVGDQYWAPYRGQR
ncbi:MAG: Gfo/Idh/MocA family oxidoreductase, partial [Chloroflexota bacterium]